MAQQGFGLGISTQIQQTLAYWRTRIEAIRSQWLGRLGGGGLISRPTSLIPTARRIPTTRSRRTPTVRRTPTRTAHVTIRPAAQPTRKVGVPGEKYDFSYKSRRVGVPGEKYDFSY